MSKVGDSKLRPRSLELHIERLVLHGFPSCERQAIAEALENQLSELFRDQLKGTDVPSTLSTNAEHARLDAGTFNVAPGSSGHSVGGQIARTVHRELAK